MQEEEERLIKLNRMAENGGASTQLKGIKKGDNNNNINNNKNNGNDNQKVPFYKLFAFADKQDAVLMIVGTISAIGSGLAHPFMTLIFGHLINSFGSSDRSHVVHEVSKVIKPALLHDLSFSFFFVVGLIN